MFLTPKSLLPYTLFILSPKSGWLKTQFSVQKGKEGRGFKKKKKTVEKIILTCLLFFTDPFSGIAQILLASLQSQLTQDLNFFALKLWLLPSLN